MSRQTQWNALRKLGLSEKAAAVIMGHAMAESGCETNRVQGDFSADRAQSKSYTAQVDGGQISKEDFTKRGPGGGGYGWMQWTYPPRKEGLYNTAKKLGVSIGSEEAAVAWLWDELNQGEYAAVLSALKGSGSIREISDVFMKRFERPADQSDRARQQRAALCEAAYNEFAGSPITASPATGQTAAQTNAVPRYTAKRLIAIAVAEIGYHEKISNSNLDDKNANSGSGNWTKYARDLAAAGYYNGNKNGYAWCDVFVDWCFYILANRDARVAQMIECQTGDCGAGCLYSRQYYQQQGRLYNTPQPGDQVFFTQNGEICHTGIVETVNGNSITTIEGNTSDQVARRSYTLGNGYVKDFGRPKYDPDDGSESPAAPAQPAGDKTVDELAQEVLQGLWGNGDDRRNGLTAAGYDYNAVQSRVNAILSGRDEDTTPAASTPSVAPQTPVDVPVTPPAPVDTSIEPGSVYVVQSGDTLSSISVRCGIGYQEIAAYNGIENPNLIYVGQRIRIPGRATQGAVREWFTGDVVNFIGNTHYVSSGADQGSFCLGGKARITGMYKSGKHPYHLIALPGSGSTVYGWVDAADITDA